MAEIRKLNDNVESGFLFDVVEGMRYEMRYPVTEEIEQMRSLNEELEAAQEAGDKDKEREITDKTENFVYDLISPVGHATPIKDALATVNIRVLRNFSKMLEEELAIR